MFLSRIRLNLRSKEARRDLADPYELHSTLCRAFSPGDRKCPAGEFLWRLEPESSVGGNQTVLIQSRSVPEWSRIECENWMSDDPDPAIDLDARLDLCNILVGKCFRFRVRANPSKCRDGKRLGLLQAIEQENWIARKGREQHGFVLPSIPTLDPLKQRVSVGISQEQMLRGNRRGGNPDIRVFSVLYDGVLTVSDPDRFGQAVRSGIGHGKALGLGLLSVVPVG